MKINIRPFTPEDYRHVVALDNACYPDNPTEETEVRRRDSIREAKYLHRRLVAEWDGEECGYASYGHQEWMFYEDRFFIAISVHPGCRHRGIGTALYDAALSDLKPLNPKVLRSYAREDMADSVRFLDKRGFVEEHRDWESRLDVTSFDPSRFPNNEERLRAEGIELTTFGQLASDPERDVKMHALDTVLMRDLPSPEPLTDISFDQYRKYILESPNLLPEGVIVAVHGDEYIGLSALWKSKAHDDLETGLTGVLQPWRRKGIALAMKLRAIDYARRHNYKVIRTDNDSTNRGMLSINESLGFAKMPVWIGYAKTMKQEPETMK